MPASVYHVYTHTVADGTATSVVRPSDWNSSHAVTLNISGTDIVGAFSNANNVSFNTNPSGFVTASASFPAQTVDTNKAGTGFSSTTTGGVAIVGTNNTNGLSLGVPAFITTAMVSNAGSNFLGTNTALTANGVSMTANSSGISLNVPAFLTTAAQSNHSHNFATTTTNGASIVVGTANSAGATIGVPAFLTTAQPVGAYLTTAAVSDHSHNFATTTTNGSQIVVGTANSAGATIGVPPFITTFTQPGATVFSNSNNVSFGLNGSTVTATATFAQSNQTGNFYVAGNTTQLSSTAGIDLRSVSFEGAGVASVGVSNGRVLVSVPAGGGGQSVAVSGSNGSFNFSTLSMGSSNGMHFYTTNGSIVGSYTVPTQTADTNKAGTGTTYAGTNVNATVNLNTNGLALSLSANAGGAGDGYNIVSMGSSGNTTGTAWSSNSASIGLYGSGGLQISQNNSNQIVFIDNDGWRLAGNTAGTTSLDFGTADRLYLAGGNGVTLSGNNSTISINVNTAPDFWSIAGNTAGASNTYAWTNDGLYLAGGNNITLSQNGSTITISGAAQSADTNKAGIGTTTAGTNVGITLNANTNGVALSINNTDDHMKGYALYGNTAGTTTSAYTTTGAMYLAGGANVTLSGNSNTVTIVGPAPGGTTFFTQSRYDWPPYWLQSGFSSSGQTNGSVSLVRVYVSENIQFTRVDMPVSISAATSAASNGAAIAVSSYGVLYTRNAGTLNPIVGVAGTQTLTWSSNSAGYSQLTGAKMMSFGIQSTLTPGEYFFGAQLSTTSAISSGTAATTALNATISVGLASVYTAGAFADWQALSNATTNAWVQGCNSVVLTATNQTMQTSQLTVTGAQFGRAAIPLVFRQT